LDEENSNISNRASSSCDCTLLLVSGSDGTRSEMSDLSSVDSISMINDLLGIVVQVHDEIETDVENNTNKFGKVS
jgi:hypothetical protein